MENSMSRMLIQTVVKNALKSIKDNPERGIRNLIDLAMQFSEGRFQKNFFSTAQTMLQNENSAYYGLIRDAVAYTDTERIYIFGMNLGYNGCTVGAQRIRKNEKNLHCNIPWAMTMLIDPDVFEHNWQLYHTMLLEGESLGIYTWMLFVSGQPEKLLPLAKEHSDSAFCIFCKAEDINSAFLDEAAELYNTMIVIRYEESAAEICDTLRKMGLLYSVWYQYGQKDTECIINGDFFSSVQQLSPVFTVLMPEPNCPKTIEKLVYQAVTRVRNEQLYRTLVWELQYDNSLVDSIISDDSCSVYFDEHGDLCAWGNKIECVHHNLFQSSLTEILVAGCAKKIELSV
ncbi:MAG: hypothetical protein Q4E24_14555 [bacterium]|nr:hypothetical protein [bacterium]